MITESGRLRSAALRVEPPSASSTVPAAAAIAPGPSEHFIRRSRNPDLPRPARFEPTTKAVGDVVI